LLHEAEQQCGSTIEPADRIADRRMQHHRRIVRPPVTDGKPEACSSVEP
jgi:hypothetical protein